MLKKLNLEQQIKLVEGIFEESNWERLDAEITQEGLIFWPIINKKENRLALHQYHGSVVEIDVEKININVCNILDLRRFLNFFENELPPVGIPFIKVYLIKVLKIAHKLIEDFANSTSIVIMKN